MPVAFSESKQPRFFRRLAVTLSYQLRWQEVGVCIFICSSIGAFFALRFGLDANWDLRNYHFYSVYALLHDRYDIDIAPAQLQTWLNPSAEILNYALIRYVDPHIGTAIMGAISALNLAAIYILGRLVVSQETPVILARLIASCMAVAALFTPMFWSELGTTFTDANTGLLMLAALIIAWRFDFSNKSIFTAGILVGLCVGFKLTNLIFAIAFVCAILVMRSERRLQALLVLWGALCLGYLPFGATWNLFLWIKFKNPVFPFYNQVFHSPDYLAASLSDDRFKPTSLAQALSLPLKWASKQSVTSELEFRDLRFLILGILVLFFSPMFFWPAKGREFIFRQRGVLFLNIFFWVSLLLWLKLFGIQRYIVVLELLSFVLVLAMLDRIIPQKTPKILTFLIAFVFILLTTSSPDWGHIPFGRGWLEAEFPPDQKDRNVLHIMLGDEPMSYVIVSAPPTHVFIKVDGNMSLPLNTGLGQRAFNRISTFSGEVRSLSMSSPPSEVNALLKVYGLELVPGNCEQVTTRIDKLQSCLLRKL